MNTIQLIIRAFSMVPDYYQKNKIGCWIILGVNLLFVLAGILNTFRLSRAIKGPRAFLYIVLRVILLFGALTFGIMLLLASEVAEASPEQFNFGFYIEIIVAGIILAILLYRTINEDTSSEEASDFFDPEKEKEDAANAFVKAVAVVILSVIFMIFGNGLIRWGFSLFGKKVGAWFFGLYAGAAVGIIFDLLKEVTDLLLSALRDTVDDIPSEKLPGHKEGASNGAPSRITIPTGRPSGGKPTIGKTSGSAPSGGKSTGNKSPRSKSSGFKDGLLSFLKRAAIFFIAFVILTFGAVVVNRIMNPAPKMPANHVMVWNDSVLESKMREITGIYSGDIWLKDVWKISELDLGRSYDDVESTPVRNLQALSELENLKELYLDNSELSDISALAGFTSLTLLSLDYNQISDISPLSQLSSLNILSLESNQISDISPLADLQSLNTLSLWGNQISDISPLADLHSLNSLSLSENQISDISPLAGLHSLNTLYLWENQISDISPLAGLHSLNSLSLWENQISDISPLAGLTSLKILDITMNQISDISPLERLTSLKILSLSYTPISDISVLAGFTELQELRMGYVQVTSVAPLRDLKNLTYVDATGTPLTDAYILQDMDIEELYL